MREDFLQKIELIKMRANKVLADKILLRKIALVASAVLVVVLLIVFIATSDMAQDKQSMAHSEQSHQAQDTHSSQDFTQEQMKEQNLVEQDSQQDFSQSPQNLQPSQQDFASSSQVPQALQNPQSPLDTPKSVGTNAQNPQNSQYPALNTQESRGDTSTKYEEVKVSASQAQGLGIKDIPIQNPSITRGVPFNALIDFDDKESATQSSTFDVVVVGISMREGEAINEGDEICEINSNELNNSYFELENARNRYRVAQEVAQKDKGLYESGVISQREYQTSYLASRELYLKLSQLENSFKLFGIDPKNPKGKSGFRVVASSSGILSVAPKTTGEKIPAFTPYVRISKSSDLLARIKIPASISDYVVPGSKVYSEQGQYVGDISTVSVVIDKTNNSITAIAKLQKGVFRVGEVADIYIEGKQPKGTFALPSDAIIKNGKDNLIFIKTQEGYIPRVVNIVEKRSKSFVIDSSGFKGDEKVASGSLIALKGLINNVGIGGSGH
ncbi:efflux RND transporter periplasmic adaptor subunit [Helicobacter macacae]|uniref:RND efflux pump membrane fusion protein barrel-sandwich domain-containing protein n=1 Tax=Helicobacter macacae MIT 99-5501 TaxID=1357400 RepID=V8CD03_9HELI|nr:hypothetical protein [Helicobacter macacae]ETD24957.1 hypothetical protein HMPREF2086_00291 [Helicobacter macacae MIT 99-5501]